MKIKPGSKYGNRSNLAVQASRMMYDKTRQDGLRFLRESCFPTMVIYVRYYTEKEVRVELYQYTMTDTVWVVCCACGGKKVDSCRHEMEARTAYGSQKQRGRLVLMLMQQDDLTTNR